MTIEFAEGAPYWVDLATPDLAKATDFYRRVFGWDALDLGEEAGHYTMFSYQEQQVGAAGPIPKGEDIRPAWTVYFKVTDAHAAAKAVQEYGGTVVMAPMDVFDQTTLAYFTDPAGVSFAVSKPRGHKGAQRWSEPNSAAWVELMVREKEPSLGFYREVFGWSANDGGMAGQEYTLLRAAAARDDFGGVLVMGDDIPAEVPPQWVVYFEVVDCVATCEEVVRAGGHIFLPPKTYEGVGTFASVADPFGASFSIITSG